MEITPMALVALGFALMSYLSTAQCRSAARWRSTGSGGVFGCILVPGADKQLGGRRTGRTPGQTLSEAVGQDKNPRNLPLRRGRCGNEAADPTSQSNGSAIVEDVVLRDSGTFLCSSAVQVKLQDLAGQLALNDSQSSCNGVAECKMPKPMSAMSGRSNRSTAI
ncbi:hypothetical protein GE09DRAFT_400174 [Coniochaeta sp. 2T2.1]|nr:hypothetical protein GE09DRAFT_400174 [Coniochaeta sp. 2T2.1]